VPKPDRPAVVADHPQSQRELADGAAAGQRLQRDRVSDQHDRDDHDGDTLREGRIGGRAQRRDPELGQQHQHEVHRELHEDVQQQRQYARAHPGQPYLELHRFAADEPLRRRERGQRRRRVDDRGRRQGGCRNAGGDGGSARAHGDQ
jgi:hypothetical protein